MSAQVIKFPTKKKEIVDSRPIKTIKGIDVKEPTNKFEYLDICKNFLGPFDYQDILCGIMDKEYYEELEPRLRKIIDAYYDFPK